MPVPVSTEATAHPAAALPKGSERGAASPSQSPAEGVLQAGADLLRSCAYNALQAPIEGLAQVVDAVAGTDLARSAQVMNAPDKAKFGSLDWAAQAVGGALGMAVPLIATHKCLALGANALNLDTAVDALGERLPAVRFAAPIAQGAGTGFVYGSLLQPQSAGQSFIKSRLENGLLGAVTFGSLAGTTMALSELGATGNLQGTAFHYLTEHRLTAGIISGLPASVISSESQSLLDSGKWASGQDLARSAITYSLVGGALSTLQNVGEPRQEPAEATLTDSPDLSQKGVTLFLAGGAVRGWGHIGVLKYLDEQGVAIDHEYGASIGGLIGALHTNGYSGEQIERLFLDEFHNPYVLKTLPRRLNLRTFLRFQNLEPMMGYFTDKYSLEPNDKLHIVAYMLKQRSPYIFENSDYSMPKALRATAGIPGPFRWTRLPDEEASALGGKSHKMTLLDGGFRRLTGHDLPAFDNLIISKLESPDETATSAPTGFQTRVYEPVGRFLSRFLDTQKNEGDGTDLVVYAGKPEVNSLGFALPDHVYMSMVDHGYEQARRVLEPAIAAGRLPLLSSPETAQPPPVASEPAKTSLLSRSINYVIARLPGGKSRSI